VSKTKQQEEDFVPWSKGAELLGVKRSAFFHYVNSGQIRTLPDTPSRQGRYNLSDILEIKRRRESGKPRKAYKKRLVPVTIDWLGQADILAGLKLDRIVYQEEQLAEASVYKSWRQRNPYLSMAAFDARNREVCLGYIGLVPLPESTILDILSGKRHEGDIQPEEVEAYDRPGGYTLLAYSAAIHPDRPDLLYKILMNIMDFWIKQYPERYIRKIYAQSISTKGDILVQHFFMAPRPDLAFNAFELDLARPAASKIIRKFKEQLIAKASLPSELQYPLASP
jgi:hypothetical protein